MAKIRKFDKYITYAGTTLPPQAHQEIKTPGTELFYVHDGIIPGAFTMCCTWMTGIIPGSLERDMPQHMHADDEFLGFCGGDPYNPLDLGAEVEFWYEDDKYIFTKSVLLFIPKMTRHGPLVVTKIDHPIFIFHSMPSSNRGEIPVNNPKFSRFKK
jgi:hypothetical protein